MWKEKATGQKYYRDYYVDHKEEIAKRKSKRWQEHREEHKKYRRTYYLAHKKELAEKQKIYRQKHKREIAEYKRKRTLLRRYNLTLEQVDELLIKQDHRCAICKKPLTEAQRTIDHDHRTGEARGILCMPCNSGLGMFKEDQTVMAEAIQYLKRKA